MWCLGVLFSQTMASPKSLRVWLTDPFSRGLWEVKGHCLSFVSAEAQGRSGFIAKKYVGVFFCLTESIPTSIIGDPQKP